MTTVRAPAADPVKDASAPTSVRRRGPGAITIAVALIVAVGIALRCWTASSLWLDEALTVDIAALPLHEIPGALRVDGAPPLYYLLLHGWLRLFGTGDVAARSLSGLCSVLTLPLVWYAGRREAGRAGGLFALLLLATSPFAVYYATEARMYALVLLLVTAGHLLLQRALERPVLARLAPLPFVSAALALTHYWTLYLLFVVAVLLVVAWRRHGQPAAARCLAALALGGVVFLPWLPTFLFQSAHTGTPWSAPAQYSAILGAVQQWTGGGTNQGVTLWVLFLVLAAAGVVGRRLDALCMIVDLRPDRRGAALFAASVGTLVVGVTAGLMTGSAFAGRYTTVALLPFLLLVVRGRTALPGRVATPVMLIAVAAGLAMSALNPLDDTKTNAPVVADVLRAQAAPVDVVVYCPDQLGPSTHRALDGQPLRQVVYPTGEAPDRIDWTDYEKRNLTSDPLRFATRLRASLAPGARVFLVEATDYRTYEGKCELLDQAFAQGHRRRILVANNPAFSEHPGLIRYDAGHRP